MVVCKAELHIGGAGQTVPVPGSELFSSHLWFLNSKHHPLNVISNLKSTCILSRKAEKKRKVDFLN